VKQDERAPFLEALMQARLSAYPPGEFVGQESFMVAGEILALARQAGIGVGISVLDLCCGVAGPGRFITQQLGCSYLGVDCSSSALDIARELAGDLPCRFEVSQIPPIPPGPFDVVLLLETMLAFPEKGPLLLEISQALKPGGRFAFTLEEGMPLSDRERETMPDADTVWLTPRDEVLAGLKRAGFQIRWQDDRSQAHRAVADALTKAFAADTRQIAAKVGGRALEELLTAHRLWSDWLRTGRVRKLAFVAQKVQAPPPPPLAGVSEPVDLGRRVPGEQHAVAHRQEHVVDSGILLDAASELAHRDRARLVVSRVEDSSLAEKVVRCDHAPAG
jgi:SAM-dependent methyltransferase